ncbi:uncharacterized protein NPIL_572941 [Nephila pilipes]|uniref:Chaoptin n=1 Tax=Nephila pilipes TaxID=299642 RepID=A0A8X6P2G9_NEPPI|nr:uncharacterized protein NPIL_572941 [Nephila pilipes]
MKKLFLLTALLAFFTLVTSQKKCPLPKLLEPCKCTSDDYPVLYVCNNIIDQDALNTAFRNSYDYPLDALSLRYSSLLYLPISLLKTKNISFIAISDSTMASIFDEPPHRQNKLENVILRNISLQRGVDWSLFSSVSPKIIQIEQVAIKRIGLVFTQSIRSSLTQLTLLKTKTASFNEKAFSKLTNLHHFECSYNRIKVLKRSMFSDPSPLNYLDFTQVSFIFFSDCLLLFAMLDIIRYDFFFMF